MKILKLLWEVIFPFEIVWITPEQKALRTRAHPQCRQPIKMETTQSLNARRTQTFTAVDVVAESQAGNAPGKRGAA